MNKRRNDFIYDVMKQMDETKVEFYLFDIKENRDSIQTLHHDS